MAIAPRLIRSPATQQFLLGQSLSKQAADQAGQPVYATSQGLARIAQALGGALLQNRGQQKYKEEQAADAASLASMLGGAGFTPGEAALFASELPGARDAGAAQFSARSAKDLKNVEAQNRPPKYENVLLNGVPTRMTSGEQQDAMAAGDKVAPYTAPRNMKIITLTNGEETKAFVANPESQEQVQELLNAGWVPANPPGDTLSLEIGEDGSVSLKTGNQGVAAAIPASRAVAEGKGLGQRTVVIERLEDLLADVGANPDNYGVVGAVKGVVQDVGGVLEDLDPTNFTGSIKKEIAKLYPDDVQAREEFDPFFDPKLPKSTLAIHAIAFQLAADRINVREGGIRSLKSEFERTREDLKLRGFGSSAAVKARLEEALLELRNSQDIAQKALGQSTQTPEQGDNPTVRTVTFEED